jgi:hypothetical protein
MSFVFRLEDYPRYLQRVGGASYIDVTRRTDPARIGRVWGNLYAVVRAYGAPWIVQVWTKDAAGVLKQGGSVLRCLADLSALLGGPEHVTWRYDPIIPTVHQVCRFRWLARRAAELGISRCVINFLAAPGRYKRVDLRLARVLPGWADGMPGYDDDWRAEIAHDLVEIAGEFGLEVSVCAESAGLVGQVLGLGAAACGDYDWFVALSGRDPGRAPTTGSRPGCGCAAYFDVGLYGQRTRCHQCLYCYAG